MSPLNLRAFEVCYGVGMSLSGEVPVEVLELVLGSREKAEDEAWRLQCAKRDREARRDIPV